MHFRQVI